MPRNPNLNVPLTYVLENGLARTVQCVLHLYTVGDYLRAWRDPKNKRRIENLFDDPEEASQAVIIFCSWLEVRGSATIMADRFSGHAFQGEHLN